MVSESLIKMDNTKLAHLVASIGSLNGYGSSIAQTKKSMISNLLVISICLDLMIQFNHVNIYQFIIIVMTTYSVVVQMKTN